MLFYDNTTAFKMHPRLSVLLITFFNRLFKRNLIFPKKVRLSPIHNVKKMKFNAPCRPPAVLGGSHSNIFIHPKDKI